MAVELLSCERDFYDGAEHLPVKESQLELVGSFPVEGLDEKAINNEADKLGGCYWNFPPRSRFVFVFKYREDLFP